MYLEFFGLARQPFQLTPDVQFFFDSRVHKRALATIIYGLSKKEGFVVVTGEVGSGKTTLIEYLIASPSVQDVAIARISTTQLGSDTLLEMIAGELGLSQRGDGRSKAWYLRELNEQFLRTAKTGRNVLLIVDEVQNLSPDSLEELRMLSNFQAREQPLVQMLLVGQPEFRQRLAGQECEQIRQRVIASYHLVPLTEGEIPVYIEHRMKQAGYDGPAPFTRRAYRRIQEETGGLPRKINRLCDRLLLYGYLEETRQLDGAAVDAVIAEMRQENLADPQAELTSAPDSRAKPSPAPASAEDAEGQPVSPPPLAELPAAGNGSDREVRDYAQLLDTLQALRREVGAYKAKMDRILRRVTEGPHRGGGE